MQADNGGWSGCWGLVSIEGPIGKRNGIATLEGEVTRASVLPERRAYFFGHQGISPAWRASYTTEWQLSWARKMSKYFTQYPASSARD